jgi:hypothetical protein
MQPSETPVRAVAGRVASWLLERGRTDEAIAVLAVWAATGPNDAEGQDLLAEALRINPNAHLARLAFKHMEGLPDDFGLLEAAMTRWTPAELERLEHERTRPTVLRAQVGFNNNVKYKDQTFHIQTEDSGLDKPHVITHLFADGGRVIKSHRRSYASEIHREDIGPFVRQLMKEQQLEMALSLRDGCFDSILEGRAVGGLVELDYPPKVDLQRLATKKKSRVQADGHSANPTPPDTLPPLADEASRTYFRLTAVRRSDRANAMYEPRGTEAVIGSSGSITLPDEPFCHPREAAVRVRGGGLWLHDFESGNGVFLRIRSPTELGPGDEFIVGDQLLRIDRNPVPHDAPDPGPTYYYSSPRWPSSFRVNQLFEGGALGACVLAHGNTLQIGSVSGDFVFPSDPLVSPQHCMVEEQAGVVVLTDLGSLAGVFVRIKGQQELTDGDEILVGRTRMTLTITQPLPGTEQAHRG